ncbi:universal stress protein [Microbacterium sp. GXF7504]
MERIVVGVDGGRASRAALDWAASRCARRPSRVQVVHVLGRLARDGETAAHVLRDAEERLRGAVPDVAVDVGQVRGGTAQVLTAVARDADLLVIGIDPDRPLAAALGGWLPLRVAARSTVPVCVVPAGWSAADAEGDVAVGLAADESSTHALVVAAAEAGAAGCALRVVHAWHDPDFAVDGPASLVTGPRPVIEDHRAFLDDAVGDLRRRFEGVRIRSDLVRATPAEALVRGAEGSALIVIGTHHHGVFAGGFTGSIAQDVLWQTRSPVCIVPVPAQAAG